MVCSHCGSSRNATHATSCRLEGSARPLALFAHLQSQKPTMVLVVWYHARNLSWDLGRSEMSVCEYIHVSLYHFQDGPTLQLARSREFNGSSGKCSRKWRTRAAAPWSLNGSKSVVEVALIPYPSGKCNFNLFRDRIRIRIRSRVSVSSVSPGDRHRVATRSCA